MKRIFFIIAFFLSMVKVSGQSNIVKGEYFIDTDPGTGQGTPVTVSSPSTDVSLTLSPSTAAIQPGYHLLNYRFLDAAGHWGLTYSRGFYLYPAPPALSQIIKGEYYLDTDPGTGQGTAVTVTSPSTDVTQSIALPVSTLTAGQHTLNYRFMDASGHWSESSGQIFYVQPAVVSLAQIGYGEYYFDLDPGQGNGTSFTLTPGTNVTTSLNIPVSTLVNGFHTLQMRFRDQAGAWSLADSRTFYKNQLDTVLPVTGAEYFIDHDPGAGKGTAVSVSSPSTDLSFTQALSSGTMAVNQFHILNYRFMKQDGIWGLTTSQLVFVTDNKEKYYTPINKVEVHIDGNTGSSKLRVDSVGIAMPGDHPTVHEPISPTDTLAIGRHFAYIRGIDYFGRYDTLYDSRKFIVTNDTTKGMLLGITLAPDSSLLNSGTVEIYSDISNQLTLQKTDVLDATGNFLTDGLSQGNYLLLLKPNLVKYPTAINTYYSLAPQWQMASILAINPDTMFNDVVIEALKTKSLTGLGILSGTITQSSKKFVGITTSSNEVEARVVKGASVVLVGKASKGNVPGEVYAQTVTDSAGNYTFSNVPAGTFDLIVDITGVPLLNYYTVEVKDSAVSIGGLNYTVGGGGISFTTGIQTVSNPDLLVYPNPSNGEINILMGEFSGKVELGVYDMSGRLLMRKELNTEPGSVYPVNLGGLSRGIYNLVMTNESGKVVRKIIIQ